MKSAFILKNLASLGIKPSVSLRFPEKYLKEKKDVRNLVKLLDKLFINEICLSGSSLKNKTLQTDDIFKMLKNLDIYIEYKPDMRAYFADHPDQLNRLIRQHLFSTKDYAEGISSWNSPVYHFYGSAPEIIDTAGLKDKKKLVLENPDNIHAVIAIADDSNGMVKCVNLIDNLNRKYGQFTLPENSSPSLKLIIVRSCRLKAGERISRQFNFYHLSHAKMLQEVFTAKLKKRLSAWKGLFLNMDVIFESMSANAWPEFDFILEQYYPGLLENISRTWIENKFPPHDYDIARNEFFKNELKPDLEKLTSSMKYIIPPDHSMAPRSELSSSNILDIDTQKFIAGTPYYKQCLIQVKRTASRQYLESRKKTAVLLDNIRNDYLSFQEKSIHLDSLITAGANHFIFNYNNGNCSQPDPGLQWSEKNDAEFPYYPEWMSRLHQIGHFLKNSVPRSNLLTLYPVYDEDMSAFSEVINTLESFNIDFTLIDFDLFESEENCLISDKQITCNDCSFPIVLLPAVNTLTLAAMQKLEKFVIKGGIVLALKNLPRNCRNVADQDNFDKLKETIWFEGGAPEGTSFKKYDSGGLSLFRKELSRVSSLWQELEKYLQIEINMAKGSVRHLFHESQDAFYLFLHNADAESSSTFEIQCKFKARPYEWDFNSAESKPYPYWFTEEKRLYIKMSLAGNESKLLLLSKDKSTEVAQLAFTEFAGAEIISQEKNSLQAETWNRKQETAEAVIRKAGSIEKIKCVYPEKLPVLRLSSKSWYLECESYQGKMNLGDFSSLYPFRSGKTVFQKVIVLNDEYLKNYKLFIDLGKLKDWCILHVNSEPAGKKFSAPFAFDITDFVQKGENKLSITVFNTEANFLAKTNDEYPVREYGLFGPVKITPYGRIKINYSPKELNE